MITQETVNRNLDHAQTNGFFTDLATCMVEELVIDMLMYSVDCEDEEDGRALTPLVQAWYDAHRLIGDSQAGKAADC